MKHLLPLIFILITFGSSAQQREVAKIIGYVTDADGKPLQEAVVYLKNTAHSANVDKDGHFVLVVQPGNYELLGSSVGYLSQTISISLKKDESKHQRITLQPDPNMILDQVVVTGKSAIAEVRETPFNVVALDAKSQYNSTLDLAHLLDRASGIKVREAGGVGSDININLNGFTGQHVKIFMDGVPMQGMGSAFQLNNIPVSVAERIEVYKGVVPIEFGADAIGGVINIVTNQSTNSFLDASYSYGSFNTHRTNVTFGNTAENGFSFQINAYQNYSDNNYRIKSQILQENFQYTREEIWVRRFHDTYHNEAIVGKVGWVNKPWAERFYLGVTLSQQRNEIQNSASDIRFVYGARENSGKSILPSLEYYKRDLIIDGLSVRVTGNYNFNENNNVDTSSYRYNWYGQQLYSPTRGEVGAVNSLTDYYNSNYSSTANINYRIDEKHSVSINDMQSGSNRRISTNLPEEDLSELETMRRLSLKNVLGVSYRYRHSRAWNVNVFGKNYYQKVTGPFNQGEGALGSLEGVDPNFDEAHPNYVERTASYNTTGYGIATTYFLKDYQFKASMERAYRLPTDNELFGDEILEAGNGMLRAENSMNYNAGVTMNRELANKDVLYLDVSGFYRDTKDFIRRMALQRSGGIVNVNHGQVRNIGADVEARYYYRNKAMIGGTLTYQDMRNKEGLRSPAGSAENATYNNRMPNIPYFFGNADVAYYIHGLGGNDNVLNLSYGLNFVGEFYLFWESMGDPGMKKTLPRQLSHDFTATYVMKNGKYNFTLEARNITDEELFDNFSLMKPGRAFYAKFRYYLMKRK